MIKKTTCILLFLVCHFAALSQYAMNILPPANDFSFEDLWNINISNSGVSDYKILYINVKVTGYQKGLLISADSKKFENFNGVKNINRSNLQEVSPFTIAYTIDKFYSELSLRGGFFPAGQYEILYSLFGSKDVSGAGQFDPITTSQVLHATLMTAPLQLVSVFDKDTIEEKNPTFSWVPASGTITVAELENTKTYNVTYRIEIAELLTNQTPYAAITSNPKVYAENNLNNTFVTYPFSARMLEPGKTYVWQVHAVIANRIITSSEVWRFTIRKRENKIVPQQPVLVKQQADLSYCHVADNTVSFAYYEEYDVEDGAILNVELLDSKNKRVMDAAQLGLKVKKGLNTYNLTACAEGLDLKEDFYMMVIKNAKNEKWYLRIFNDPKVNTCN